MSLSESQDRVRLTDDERLDRLRLIRSENVGPRTFLALVNQFGDAQAAFGALPHLARRGGVNGAARICTRAEAEREVKAARSAGVSFVALGEPGYPSRLRMIDDPPPLIAVRGQLAVLDRPMIAVVGARNASAAGIKLAGRLAREFGEAGLVVASGLAPSTPPPIGRRWKPAPSRRWPAATTASIRRSMWSLPPRSWRKAPRCRKCRSTGSRGRATFRAAIA